jgi:hypothetical protein
MAGEAAALDEGFDVVVVVGRGLGVERGEDRECERRDGTAASD